MIYVLIVLTSFYCNGSDCIKVVPAKSIAECQQDIISLRARISAAADDEIKGRIAMEDVLEMDVLQILKGEFGNYDSINALDRQSGGDEQQRLIDVAKEADDIATDNIDELTEARTHIFKSMTCESTWP